MQETKKVPARDRFDQVCTLFAGFSTPTSFVSFDFEFMVYQTETKLPQSNFFQKISRESPMNKDEAAKKGETSERSFRPRPSFSPRHAIG